VKRAELDWSCFVFEYIPTHNTPRNDTRRVCVSQKHIEHTNHMDIQKEARFGSIDEGV